MKAWDSFLKDLEEKIGTDVVTKWLRPLKVINFDAHNLYLEAENTFQITWFEEQARKWANTSLLNTRGKPIKIHFSNKAKRKQKQVDEERPLIKIHPDPLDETMHFTNFATGEESALVAQFCKQLTPGAFNPLFLYGPSGTGKTHLIMALAHKLQRMGLGVFYVHAETFAEHVVKAIRESQMQEFRQIYRNQDVLIVDDVHYLARKTATQEEFFHTFNTLHTAGKQIILTSELPPSKLEEIEPRLISRFEWGIVLQLTALPIEKIALVLRNKARLHHFPLPPDVVDFLKAKFSSSAKATIRALEALMIRHRAPGPISLAEAEALLEDLLQAENASKLTPEKILHTTSAYFGIRQEDILGKSQAKECAFPRKLAMFLCRKQLDMPYLSIGRFFGRDHSTVMTSIKHIEKKRLEGEIETILEEIFREL